MGCEYSTISERDKDDPVNQLLHTSIISGIKVYDIIGTAILSLIIDKILRHTTSKCRIQWWKIMFILLMIDMNLHYTVCKHTKPKHIKLFQDTIFLVNFIRLLS
jgi:hypothetical protein